MNSSEKLVFIHVPKTAGTTIHNILVNNFEKDEICPERFNNLDRFDECEMNGWKYYSGHFNFSSVEKIPGEKKIITILREPQSRIVSLYNFWKSHRDEHVNKHNLGGPSIAKKLSLEEFVTSERPELSGNIDNVYTRIYSGYMDSQNLKTLSKKKQTLLLDVALKNLKSFNFVGCLENPSRSIEALLQHLNYSVPGAIPIDNSISAKCLPPHLEKIENANLNDVSTQSMDNLTFLDKKIYQIYFKNKLD